MELENDKTIKTSFQIAYENSNRLFKNKEVKIQRQSFFVDDDRSQHVFEQPKKVEYSDVKFSPENDEVESLTFPQLPEPSLEDYPVKVHYTGPMFDYGGYAKMNRVFIFGLHGKNALIKVHPFESITNVNKKTEETLRSFENISVPNKYPKIFAMTVPDLMNHGGKKILYTMMETSNKVHKKYAERLNLADEIWTPTHWCKEVFENSKVYPPIKVMPLGVDTDRYKPGLEPLGFGSNVRSFKFLSVSGWSYRKGFDVSIRAFLEEFSNKDDISMVISTRFAGGLSKKDKDRILSDFRYFRGLVNKKDSELPHVALHNAYTEESKMPRLYSSANCFILISRGEGWGLPYCEAASCGLPIIASNHGGQKDFLNNDNSYLVSPSSYFLSTTKDPAYKNMAWISSFYEDQEFPDYEGDSFEMVKSHMRNVYENYDEAKRKANILRNQMVNKFTWDHAVQKIYERLEEICKEIDSR